ncbi:hypothetical protein [Edaphobacter aggregans]|uniref:hypothetical protein n=1 Tax=Edaphobacter aggregans TaxID=570835 RepID=UPI000553E9ED|nr:hypothetical protein [Edaphobacter aggregans]
MMLGTSWIKKGLLLATGTLGLAFAVQTSAQVQTTTTTTAGESSHKVKVDRGEVYAVNGNDLIVKMEDGSFQHFPDVPETARATVDGKQLGIHDLKPGMKLQRTIVTTTTPMTVTTIQTVTGKVWHVSPPRSVILTLENNTNQEFKIPQDQKFNVDGQMVDAFALKKGMIVTATKIVEVPTVVSSLEKNVTGTMPQEAATPQKGETAPTKSAEPPTATKPKPATGTVPPSPPPDAPLLIAEGEPTAVPAEAESPAGPVEPAREKPSYLPWIGLAVLLVVILIAVRLMRSKASK